MKRILPIALAAAVLATAAACGSKKTTVEPSSEEASVVIAVSPRGGTSGQNAYVPKARIYKTNGNYSENVPVTCDPSSGAIVSYPAPGDLTGQAPVALDGGWLLDRRGVGPDTRFTTYTYKAYSSLPSAPTADELKKAIIPEARVTEVVEMPFAYSAECAAACDSLIRLGLPGCRPLVRGYILPSEK